MPIPLGLLLCTWPVLYSAFTVPSPLVRRRDLSLKAKPSDKSALLEGMFAASEWFGRLTSPTTIREVSAPDTSSPRKSVAEVAELVRLEYEKVFWATGDMDLSLWQDNCTFSDPFYSFGGPGSSRRFKRNADNLGRFVEEPRLRVTSFKVEDRTVSVGWVFSGVLRLPWRPVLAAAGETTHVLNSETLLIERYEERWKSDPLEVVKRLFVPGKK